MKSAIAIVLCLSVLHSAWAAAVSERGQSVNREVCYDIYGCFSSDSPWTSLIRPLIALPKPPYEVGTRFLLFTRGDDDEEGYELMPDKEAILAFSPYDNKKKTILLIHGFTDSHRSQWMVDARTNLLQKEDVNILAVDWAPGARGQYLQAVGNTRLVGAQAARMISFIEAKGGLNIQDVHIIGHSLGAQIAGYIGDRLLNRVPHITALDPAEPYFGGADKMVRLDDGDAVFVEVIHTNGNGALNIGMGLSGSVGTVDVYPNGGKSQPGCNDLLGTLVGSIVDLITWNFEGGVLSTLACSHYRSTTFFTESILSSCPFVAYTCKSYSEFNKGNCYSTCAQSGSCIVQGYGSTNFRSITGDFYLHTADGSSGSRFCLQSVRVDAPVGLSQKDTTGDVAITFRSASGSKSDKFKIVDGRITSGQLLNQWTEVPSSILPSATEKPIIILRYTRGGLLPTTQPKFLELQSITLNVLDQNLSVKTLTYSGVTLEAGVDLQISG